MKVLNDAIVSRTNSRPANNAGKCQNYVGKFQTIPETDEKPSGPTATRLQLPILGTLKNRMEIGVSTTTAVMAMGTAEKRLCTSTTYRAT